MIYKNGKVYEGEWSNDKKHGQGAQRFPNGTIYIGKYENGKPHG